MKKVYTIIAWILGIIMCFMSLIVLLVAPIGTALAIIGIFAFFMFGLIMSIRKYRTDNSQKTPAKDKPIVDTSNRMLSELQLHSNNCKQLLESLYLIENTRNVKTLGGCIDFVLSVYDRFIVNSHFDRYDSMMKQEIETYTLLYYDREISDAQMQLIGTPNKTDLMNFISRCICKSYVRYTDFEIEQISHLVKQAAIDRHHNSLLAVRDEYIALYNKFDIPELDNVERIKSYAISHRPVK